MDGRRKDGWVGGWMHGCMDSWMVQDGSGWTDGWFGELNGWINKWMRKMNLAWLVWCYTLPGFGG